MHDTTTKHDIAAPAGMTEVSKDQFYEAIGPRDIVLSSNSPDFTTWETRNRTVVGRTYPGWKNPRNQKAYFLDHAALQRVPKVS
jgi:hypothetical protein